MADRRRQRQRKNKVKEVTNLITAGAVLIIAVLMVTACILYIRNNSFLGGLFGADTGESTVASSEPETSGDITVETVTLPEPGLNVLGAGEIVYVIAADDAGDYDEANLIEMSGSSSSDMVMGETSSDIQDGTDPDAKYYLLASSWLELNDDLYYFDEEGYACTDEYLERAFEYGFNENGTLASIKYNESYHEDASNANSNYPGLVQTRALSVYMDQSRTWGDYVAIKYKRATESLTYYLGRETNIQYSSPYAFDIYDGRIYYLAVSDESLTDDEAAVYETVAGKVFCMTPGSETRYIAAEGALGFKLMTGDDGDVAVYYYDGSRIRRSTGLREDENMVIFSEDADYTVNTGTAGKAYLELVTGQRVTMASDSFKAGNFTYQLAADGEILSVAQKMTVSTGGYTYEFQNGSAFGVAMTRLIRTNDQGSFVISGEIAGQAGNIHFDYGTSSIIAEYTDNNGGGGLLRASLEGDIDLLTQAKVTSGTVTLYGISGGYAIYRVTDDEVTEFRSASISLSSPLAAAVDSVPLSGENGETVAQSESQGSGTVQQGQGPPPDSSVSGTTDTGSDTVISESPGSVDISTTGPGG